MLQGIVDMAADDAEEPHVPVQFALDMQMDGLLLSEHLATIRGSGQTVSWVYLNPPFDSYKKFADVAFRAFKDNEFDGLIFLAKGNTLWCDYVQDFLQQWPHAKFDIGHQKFEDYEGKSPFVVSIGVVHKIKNVIQDICTHGGGGGGSGSSGGGGSGSGRIFGGGGSSRSFPHGKETDGRFFQKVSPGK